ncbi:MAG: hypothetical protein H6733_17960 [Alphaproteobacteria bacterium]|nr:hypothetical protein [Alphaproteobacteria bacterium]
MPYFFGHLIFQVLVPLTVMVFIPALLVANEYREVRRGHRSPQLLAIAMPPLGPGLLAAVAVGLSEGPEWSMKLAFFGAYVCSAWLIGVLLARAGAPE